MRPLSPAAVLRGSLGALKSARSAAAREGWTAPLMARAVAALRIAGALARGKQVAQVHATNGKAERVGQLEVRTGIIRRRRVLLSAATTPAALLAAMENGSASTSRETLQPILEALQQFSVAVYGREGEADAVALSNAVDAATAAVNRMWIRSLIPFASPRPAEGPSLPATRAGSAA